MEEQKLTAIFTGDTKKFHRYEIEPTLDFAGSLYFRKSLKELPKQVTIELRVKKLDAK